MKHTIDAKDKKLGRLASQVAVLLMGKNTPEFQRNIVADVKVHVTNASKLKIDPKKIEDKEYAFYSGYPGGLKMKAAKTIIKNKGVSEIFKEAVYGMLPTNKLRSKMIKNLIISE
jgi:large subunit ribosomal protein L13